MVNMPPLPEPVAVGVGYWDEYVFGYTRGQMREYGQACIAAERERCAKVCDEYAKMGNEAGYSGLLIADKIRSKT